MREHPRWLLIEEAYDPFVIAATALEIARYRLATGRNPGSYRTRRLRKKRFKAVCDWSIEQIAKRFKATSRSEPSPSPNPSDASSPDQRP